LTPQVIALVFFGFEITKMDTKIDKGKLADHYDDIR
jgi:hypothetical protein